MSKVLKWIVNIILLAAIVIAGALLIPPLTGVSTLIVDGTEMETNLPQGSVAYAVDKDIQSIKANDNVLIDKEGNAYVYRVNTVNKDTGEVSLRDVKSVDSTEVTETFRSTVSKVVIVVPYIGYIVTAMKSTEGLIIIGLAVVFVIILFILAELWKTDGEDDFEDDEEDEDENEDAGELPQHIDMPSHIMEKVSSEIASEISSAVEENEAAQLEEQTILAGMMAEEESEEQLEEPEEDTKEPENDEEQEIVFDTSETEISIEELMLNEEQREEEAAIPDLAKVLEEQLAQAEPQEQAEEGTSPEEDTEQAEMEAVQEVQNEDIELAMPVYTAAELIQKAQEAGDEPEVVRDDEAGITLVDYSDIL